MGLTTPRIVRVSDLCGTFVFAVEGALAAVAAGLDPVGILLLAFLTALGGGVVRDLLIGATPPAAVSDRYYAVLVIVAAVSVWLFNQQAMAIPPALMTALDAAGLALFVVAGTEKALDRGIDPVIAPFLGTVGGVGGGVMRDIAINQVPRILYADIYASAGFVAASIIVIGRIRAWPPRTVAIVAGCLCFGLRVAAVAWHWQLPRRIF
jgi:uncharacterized membrane protein YeiH